MNYGDWIFLGVLLIMGGVGALVGFGKGLRLMTHGRLGIIFSTIICIILCYLFGSMILDIPFVGQLLADLAAKWAHIGFFVKIRLEIIIFYVALFILMMIVFSLIILIVSRVAESDNTVIKVFNKIGGAIIFIAMAFLLTFFVFQIIHWIGNTTAANFEQTLLTNAKAIVLPLYKANPMNGLVDFIKGLK